MSARETDPIIQEARERMRAAAGHAKAAAAELLTAKRVMARHPDVPASGMTLARWYVEYLDSVLDDGPLGGAAGWIQNDLRGTPSHDGGLRTLGGGGSRPEPAIAAQGHGVAYGVSRARGRRRVAPALPLLPRGVS